MDIGDGIRVFSDVCPGQLEPVADAVAQFAQGASVVFFGPPWLEPRFGPVARVLTPVGMPCGMCGWPLREGCQGLMLPHLVRADGAGSARPGARPWHRECVMLLALGPLAHLIEECACFSDAPKAPPVGARERYLEAVEAFERVTGGRAGHRPKGVQGGAGDPGEPAKRTNRS